MREGVIVVSDVAEGLRDRKKAQLREELIATALRLFEEQGFEETTVQQIADAVQVSRRTFHRHFPSKESVVFRHEEDLVAEMLAALARRPRGESALTALRAAVREHLLEGDQELRRRQADNVRRVRRMLLGNPALRRANFTGAMVRRDALARGFAERAGVAEDDLRAELAAGLCFIAVTVGLDRWTLGNDHSIAALRTMLDFVLAGVQDGTDVPAVPALSPNSHREL